MAIALIIVSPKIVIHWYWLILVNEPRGYAKTQSMLSIFEQSVVQIYYSRVYGLLELMIINPFLN